MFTIVNETPKPRSGSPRLEFYNELAEAAIAACPKPVCFPWKDRFSHPDAARLTVQKAMRRRIVDPFHVCIRGDLVFVSVVGA